MSGIKHVNFESIKIVANESIAKMHKNSQHPSEVYDYVPESQRDAYDLSDEPEIEEKEDFEIEILPYDVYLLELEKSRRATFVGWNDLEVLRIHNCRMDEIYWEMFDGLTKLQHLSLEHNEIKVIPPFAFYGALNIKTLSLAGNSILDLHYRALAGLLELKYLDLSSNNLTKLSEMTFPPFPNLDEIDLRNNPIEFILPLTFAIVNSTKQLILGSKEVALNLGNTAGAFLALDHLNVLNIINVTTPSLYQSMFAGLKNLERLKMKGTIERIELDAFAEMPRIKELILSDCGIFEISMDAFYGVKNLRTVDLSKNQLFVVPHDLFEEQKHLTEVYLHQNQLTKLPKNFFKLPSLKLVRLTDNPWICSCEMLDWIQAATNSIRLTQITSTTAVQCIHNPKTGKLEGCSQEYDDFPRYTYGFDNKMSPLCGGGPNEHKYHSVYYALRHTVGCSQPTALSKQKAGKRAQNKLQLTMDKLARTKNELSSEKFDLSWSAQQRRAKRLRKQQSNNKLKRTLNKNAKILKEQVFSNNIAY